MKTKLYLLFFFVFPLFMSACRGDDPIPDPPVDGKRTVLVYMAADNSINPLASFTDGDLEELKAGMYNPQIQISAESETKRSIFREKDKTKRSKKESAQHSKSRNKSFVMTSVSAL